MDGFQKTGALAVSKEIFCQTENAEGQNNDNNDFDNLGFVGKVAKESSNEVFDEKMGGSGSEDLDETVIFEDAVEDVVESGSVTKQDGLSYVSRILNENLSDNESDDEICILEEITLNKDETKVPPMKTEVKEEVIESTIEIDGSPYF